MYGGKIREDKVESDSRKAGEALGMMRFLFRVMFFTMAGACINPPPCILFGVVANTRLEFKILV
jgi:hypothetical protein